MRLINSTNAAIMYALNKNNFKELKPNAFIFVPDECRNLQLKPTGENVYTLSVDQMMNSTLGEINNIVVAPTTKPRGVEANTLVVNEDPQSVFGHFLNYAYVNYAGFNEHVYAPKFDITTYSLDDKKVVKISADKVNKRLKQITNTDQSKMWIMIVLLIIVALIIIPPMTYFVMYSKHD